MSQKIGTGYKYFEAIPTTTLNTTEATTTTEEATTTTIEMTTTTQEPELGLIQFNQLLCNSYTRNSRITS